VLIAFSRNRLFSTRVIRRSLGYLPDGWKAFWYLLYCVLLFYEDLIVVSTIYSLSSSSSFHPRDAFVAVAEIADALCLMPPLSTHSRSPAFFRRRQ
jgi:hypothetical protein